MKNKNDNELTRLSKFLSLVLRHQPEEIGLDLDPEGWASVDELISKAKARGKRLDLATLQQIVAENDKQRFRFSADGRKIRANQGHSIEVQLLLPATPPPAVLYHGTAERFLDSIFAQGLLKGQRQHVHLSAEVATAQKVGARHGRPAVLEIATAAMVEAGISFYLADNGVWLTEHVPAIYLKRLQDRG